jgi:hypothetical protein
MFLPLNKLLVITALFLRLYKTVRTRQPLRELYLLQAGLSALVARMDYYMLPELIEMVFIRV